MFALFLIAVALTGAIGLGIGFPRLERKWDQIMGDRSEQKLLRGMVEVEVREIDDQWETTADDIAEAEAELEKEMADW